MTQKNSSQKDYLINNIDKVIENQQQEIRELSKTDTSKQNDIVKRICEANSGAVFIQNIIKNNPNDIKLFMQNIGTKPQALTNLWQAVDKISPDDEKKKALKDLYTHMNGSQRKEFVQQASIAGQTQQVVPTHQRQLLQQELQQHNYSRLYSSNISFPSTTTAKH